MFQGHNSILYVECGKYKGILTDGKTIINSLKITVTLENIHSHADNNTTFNINVFKSNNNIVIHYSSKRFKDGDGKAVLCEVIFNEKSREHNPVFYDAVDSLLGLFEKDKCLNEPIEEITKENVLDEAGSRG